MQRLGKGRTSGRVYIIRPAFEVCETLSVGMRVDKVWDWEGQGNQG